MMLSHDDRKRLLSLAEVIEYVRGELVELECEQPALSRAIDDALVASIGALEGMEPGRRFQA
jgi:hypothetical protein